MTLELLPTRTFRRTAFEPNTGCWLWLGGLTEEGYPSGGIHRNVYRRLVGPILPRFQLDHLCRVRCCLNPQHLEPVTASENTRRALGLREGFCVRGHELTEANAYWRTGRLTAACRVCVAAAQRTYQRRKRKAA